MGECEGLQAGNGVAPSLNANDAYERRLAEVLAYVRNKKAQQMQSQAQ